MTTERKKDLLIHVFFWITIAAGIYFVLKYLFVWMLPFIIGMIVAIALQNPIDYLTKKTRVPRSVWAIFLVVFTLAAISGIVIFLGSRIYVELWGLVNKLPELITPLSDLFSGWSDTLENALQSLPKNIQELIADATSNFPGSLFNGLASELSDLLTGLTKTIVSSAPSLLVTVVVTVVSCCFITKDYYTITQFIRLQLSPRHWELVIRTKELFLHNILKMLRGYLLLMFMTFCELAIGLLILGVNNAIALALLIAVVDILPVLGTGTILIPWSIFCFVSGNVFLGIGLVVLYAVITIVRNFAEPKVIGMQVGLAPIATLISMYIGLQLFGLLGVFIFPITLIILKSLQDNGYIKLWK